MILLELREAILQKVSCKNNFLATIVLVTIHYQQNNDTLKEHKIHHSNMSYYKMNVENIEFNNKCDKANYMLIFFLIEHNETNRKPTV